MSGKPSPLKSPRAVSAVKPPQPVPTFWALPVMKPPWPLPRNICSEPSAARARMSGLPSPLQSPGPSSALKFCQPLAIGMPPPMKPLSPLPR